MNFPDLNTSSLLFEFAWEVCNQIGGIYTVMKTKAPSMVDRWGNNYIMVGPYNQHTSSLEFEKSDAPGWLTPALQRLAAKGIHCHFGHWLIDGNPQALLLDYQACYNWLGETKYFLWHDNGISIEGQDGEVDAVVAFGSAITELLQAVTDTVHGRKIVGHFHEWMAATPIPRIRHLGIPVSTVFTTHATQLGRYVASNDPNFYSNLPWINPDEAARHFMIWSKYAIERAAAHASHIFTTVSEVTAREAEHLLGRKPDFVLPNGLNTHQFTALHEFQNLHLKYKERIHEFVMGHFFPSYSFDLDRTLYFFTSGRYEYLNKGMDLFIESLYHLNERLKTLPKPPTVVAFIITRAPTKSLNVTSLQNHLRFEDLKATCRDLEQNLSQRLLDATARGRMPTFEELFPNDVQVRLKRAMLARKTSQWPPVVTHDMWNDADDPVLRHLRHRNLVNAPGDPVKVVFHPDFVTLSSLFSLDYEQFVRGCHMGIFPSYYEPWGYTPLECLALGLPTVTTDLSGFGAYVERHVPDALQNGTLVLNRSRQSNQESIDQLTSYLFKFCELNRRERIGLRNRAERLTERFTWDVMAAHYHLAHAEALKCVEPPEAPSKQRPPVQSEPVNVDSVSDAGKTVILPANDRGGTAQSSLKPKGDRPLTAIQARAAKRAR
jgi:glycogen(starch) synthase